MEANMPLNPRSYHCYKDWAINARALGAVIIEPKDGKVLRTAQGKILALCEGYGLVYAEREGQRIGYWDDRRGFRYGQLVVAVSEWISIRELRRAIREEE
jgi:hypothetical protein